MEARLARARLPGWYPADVIRTISKVNLAGLAALLAIAATGCRKEEQAVVGVAQKAANAELKAQATATLRDQQRSDLARIPLPTKSLYVDVHEPSAWANPFISAEPDVLDLRVNLTDPNPSPVGAGTMMRPEAARRQEVQIRPADLANAIVALPPSAWRYGRVIAVAEAPGASAKDRAKVRRNVEIAIQQLNDLGIVVEEWPGR